MRSLTWLRRLPRWFARRACSGGAADQGVTLLEVLITLAILAIIIGPLTAAAIVYIRNTNATVSRMAESHDAQIAAAYFTYDVQSAGVRDWSEAPYTAYLPSVALGVPVNAGPYGCGTDTTASLVQFAWDDPAATIAGHQIRSATYAVKPISATVGELHRITCTGGAITADITVVRNVDLASPPSVTCPTDVAACTAGATPPGTVKLTLGIRAPGSTSTYTIELLGQRRQT